MTPDQTRKDTLPLGAAGSDLADRSRPLVSIVAPAFNQASTIYGSLEEIVGRLETIGVDYELIVVSDGSVDATRAEAARLEHRGIRVVAYERNLGKGYALRTGSAVARGRYIAWIDSDMDLDPANLGDFLARAREGDLDAVVGSKRHPDSVVSYPTRRRAYSWLYQQLVRILFRLDVRDTQVGMKLFRREVLDEVMPVVLVKRYAFDLEVLAVARSFGYPRIAEAPIRLDYRFGASGVHWRAIAQALWDTAAIFYRLRLLHFYERRRLLARRIAEHRPVELPNLTVVLVPTTLGQGTRESVTRLRDATPAGTRIVVAAAGHAADVDGVAVPGAEVMAAGAGSRSDRISRVISSIPSDVVAFIDQDARPSDGWAGSALGLFGDPTVGAVVGPTVPSLRGSRLQDAAGILSESRLGVGGARIRSHVGQLREVGDFPAANIFVRTAALRHAFDDGHALDDDLCATLRRRQGLAVLCSPDVVVTTRPSPLFRPYLSSLYRLGRDRGSHFGPGRPPRMRHLMPALMILVLALLPVAIALGGWFLVAWTSVVATYLLVLVSYWVVISLLHRRPALAAVAAIGAAASHAAFGSGVLGGAIGRLAHRPKRTVENPAATRR